MKQKAIKKIQFHPQYVAEQIIPDYTMAIISIVEPGRDRQLHPNWAARLDLAFHDADPDNFIGRECVYTLFDIHQAKQIISFISSLPATVKELHVHCYAGVSRSAAVAKFCAELFDCPFPATYALYNKHVYKMLRQAMFSDLVLPASAEDIAKQPKA